MTSEPVTYTLIVPTSQASQAGGLGLAFSYHIRYFTALYVPVVVKMKRSSKDIAMPDVALRLKYLSEYIRVARKRRKMTMVEVSNRLNIGYQTVVRVEKGDPSVSVAAYMSVLWLFGLDRQFLESVHPERDESGKALELSRLPARVGAKRVTRSEHDF